MKTQNFPSLLLPQQEFVTLGEFDIGGASTGFYPITNDEMISIGTRSDNNIRVPSNERMSFGVSRYHAEIIAVDTSSIYLRDLDSSHGTYINGIKVKEGVASTGDYIRLAQYRIVVSRHDVLDDFDFAISTFNNMNQLHAARYLSSFLIRSKNSDWVRNNGKGFYHETPAETDSHIFLIRLGGGFFVVLAYNASSEVKEQYLSWTSPFVPYYYLGGRSEVYAPNTQIPPKTATAVSGATYFSLSPRDKTFLDSGPVVYSRKEGEEVPQRVVFGKSILYPSLARQPTLIRPHPFSEHIDNSSMSEWSQSLPPLFFGIYNRVVGPNIYLSLLAVLEDIVTFIFLILVEYEICARTGDIAWVVSEYREEKKGRSLGKTLGYLRALSEVDSYDDTTLLKLFRSGGELESLLSKIVSQRNALVHGGSIADPELFLSDVGRATVLIVDAWKSDDIVVSGLSLWTSADSSPSVEQPEIHVLGSRVTVPSMGLATCSKCDSTGAFLTTGKCRRKRKQVRFLRCGHKEISGV